MVNHFCENIPLQKKLIFSYLMVSLIPVAITALSIHFFKYIYIHFTGEYGVFVVVLLISLIVVGVVYGVVQVILRIFAIHEYEHNARIEEVKTEFVSVASHQLRTPLATINWYTEMLRSGEGGSLTMAQQSFVEEIYSSNQRMLELVDLLLDASRLEMGKLKVVPSITKIESVLDSALADNAALITQKNLAIHRNISPSIHPIMTDPHLLQIILQNIISNATKYTPDNGAVTINVMTVTPPAVISNRNFNKSSVHIAISDTGYGIPVEVQGRIFEKLFRADNAQKSDADGTGLGLYIVKMTVEQLSGAVWFESQPGQGTTFHVVLPAEFPEPISGL